MARWGVVMNNASNLAGTVQVSSLVALLSTVLVFTACVSMLLALCAAHSSSSNSHAPVLNARREFSSGELSIAPPEEFKKQDLHSGPLSFRFSSGSNNSGSLLGPAGWKLGAGASSAINKLSSSFRISSFRDSSSFRNSSFRISSFRDSSSSFRNSSFRISSLRVDSSCKQADGVVDSLRRVRPAEPEEESSEPAVWQRVIMRGERCSPLSFPGLILYDENGNQLPSFNEETKEPDLHKDQFGSTSGSELETGF